MKRIIFFIMILAIVFAGCNETVQLNDTDGEEPATTTNNGCVVQEDDFEDYPSDYMPRSIESCRRLFSFIEGVSRYLHNDDVYVIKGIALEAYGYGRYIKLVEDFKGNFPTNDSIFMAWGNSGSGIIVGDARGHYLAGQYDKDDILIMLLTNIYDEQLERYWEIYKYKLGAFPEKPGDFRTIGCTFCVLKLSGDFITGQVIYPWEENYYDWDKLQWNIKSTPWIEFKEVLEEVLNIK